MATPAVHAEITTQPLDPEQISSKFRQGLGGKRDVGAIVSFVGVARGAGKDEERIDKLELEHYPGMTDSKLQSVAQSAQSKWKLMGVDVRHRVGSIDPEDVIVNVLVASSHRKEAFAACMYIVDYLKTDVPIWKKEHGSFGERWVESAMGEQQPRGKLDGS